MKKVLITFIMASMLPIFYVIGKHFWRGETMNIQKVCKRWGEKPLDLEKFKSASNKESIRAQMACSLLKQQKNFIGKYRWKIREMLGDYDGHYFSGMFPTYIIEVAKKRGEDSWQIVFLIDRKEKISEIIVHKNCCD